MLWQATHFQQMKICLSINDGDVTGQHGDSSRNIGDAWIVKLNGTTNMGINPVSAIEGLVYSTYPNPAHAQMTIHANNDVRLSNADIFDMLGRKWECPYEIKDDHNMIIHTAGLPPGSYVGRTLLLGKNYMIPFIVQH